MCEKSFFVFRLFSRVSLILVHVLLTALFLHAQPNTYHFDHVGIEEGLSQSFVHCILQDYRGFMWFGTNDGLNRYDGNEFKVYYSSLQDTSKLISNQVTVLFEDNRNNLWIGAGGLHRYDRLHDRFERVLLPEDFGADLLAVQILALEEDHNGDLWIALENKGLFRLERSKSGNEGLQYHLFGPYPFSDRLDTDGGYPQVRNILSFGSDLLVSFTTGVRILETAKDGLYPTPEQAVFTDLAGLPDIKDIEYWSLFNDSGGNIFVGTSVGLLQLQANNSPRKVRFYPYPEGWFAGWQGTPKQMIIDPSGKYWLSTYYGLLIFDPAHKKYQHILSDPSDEVGLGFNGLTDIFIDSGNVIWIGTGGNGLIKYPWQVKSFLHLFGRDRKEHGYSVYGIVEDKDQQLWISINGGFLRQFKRNSENALCMPSSDLLDMGITGNITIDGKGHLWFCSASDLVRFDPMTRQTERIPWTSPDRYEDSQASKSVVYVDQEGQSWVCNAMAIYHVDPASESLERFDLPVRELGQVFDLVKDRGEFWLATGGGLLRFNPQSGDWRLFEGTDGLTNGLNSNLIKCLLPDPADPDRYLWLGTGGGLHRFDISNNSFDVFTTVDGLPNNHVYCILPDGHGRLWLSTNHGLSCFNPTTNDFDNYYVEDGLQSNEFNTYAGYRSARGELFFGGINGVTAFYPEKISKNQHIPPIVLTDIQVSYKSIQYDSDEASQMHAITETDELHLRYDQNDLAFEFAALDYTHPEKNRYRYILQGLDREWIDAGTSRRATYTSLPPGKYIFRVQGSNNDGMYNAAGAALAITIASPPWQSWWAYGLYALMAALAAFGTIRYLNEKRRLSHEIRSKDLEAKKWEELDMLKSQFFANVSHEFRTPLAIIQGQMDSLLEELEQEHLRRKVVSVKGNAEHLLHLIDQLLDISRLESKKIKPNFQDGDLVLFIHALCEGMQATANFRGVSLMFDPGERSIITQFDSDAIRKVLQNLLSNALKFTAPGGSVAVQMCRHIETIAQDQDRIDRVVVKVIDNGIGIHPQDMPYIFDRYYQADNGRATSQGFGLGLALAKELTTLHFGNLYAESVPNVGTTFTLELPILTSSLSASETTAPPEINRTLLEQELGSVYQDPNKNAPIEVLEANPDVPCILVVEDNSELRHFICDILHPEYATVQAATGHEGLERTKEVMPDLVISDIMMPDMNGYDMAQCLINDELTSHIPVVLLTARAEPADRIKGLDLGVDDYLVKPFRKDELLARVRNILRKRDMLKKKYSDMVLDGIPAEGISSPQQAFILKLRAIVEKNIENEEFGVEELAMEIGMSPSNLYRKLQALTGLSTVQLIQRIRLEKAVTLLREGHNVSEVTYKVGFRSPSYFSHVFKKQFKISPKDYSGKII